MKPTYYSETVGRLLTPAEMAMVAGGLLKASPNSTVKPKPPTPVIQALPYDTGGLMGGNEVTDNSGGSRTAGFDGNEIVVTAPVSDSDIHSMENAAEALTAGMMTVAAGVSGTLGGKAGAVAGAAVQVASDHRQAIENVMFNVILGQVKQVGHYNPNDQYFLYEESH